MPVNRRWIKRVIETAKRETAPLPWTRARKVRIAAAVPTGVIRTTLLPKTR